MEATMNSSTNPRRGTGAGRTHVIPADRSLDRVSLDKQLRYVEAWITVMGRGTFEGSAMKVFLLVARAGGEVPQGDIRTQMDLSEAGTSRNIAILSHGPSYNIKGPELIESYEDSSYRRRKLVKLTAKGRQFASTLAGILES